MEGRRLCCIPQSLTISEGKSSFLFRNLAMRLASSASEQLMPAKEPAHLVCSLDSCCHLYLTRQSKAKTTNAEFSLHQVEKLPDLGRWQGESQSSGRTLILDQRLLNALHLFLTIPNATGRAPRTYTIKISTLYSKIILGWSPPQIPHRNNPTSHTKLFRMVTEFSAVFSFT